MMPDLALLVLVTIAIGIGFFLGVRRGSKSASAMFKIPFNKTYFQGLNYLLNEQPDKAVDAFVESLDVNEDTLETHLSLGNLMRKQGQVDRAIRIHQNLLARPTLSAEHQHQAHLELARDFMAAGLLDRAELLLREVIAESGVLRAIAQRYLLDIYQDEREWTDAIQVASELAQSKYMKANAGQRTELMQNIAQFYCELAEEASELSNHGEARKSLETALAFNKNCVRASILMAAQDNAAGKHKQAIKTLTKVANQGPAYLVECLPQIFNAYISQDPVQGFDQFIVFVERQLNERPSTATLLYLVELLVERSTTEPDRMQQAHTLLARHLDSRPSLAGLNKLIALGMPGVQGEAANNISKVGQLLQQLIDRQMVYRCTSCGFSGKQLHWRCPTCKHWDKMERLKGVETD